MGTAAVAPVVIVRDWDAKFDWRINGGFGVAIIPHGWSLEKMIWYAARADCPNIWDARYGRDRDGCCTVGMMIEHHTQTYVGPLTDDDPRKLEVAAIYHAAFAYWWQLHLVKMHWYPFGDTGPLARWGEPRIAPVPQERWDRYHAACREFERFWWPGQETEVLERDCIRCGDTVILRGAECAYPQAARCAECAV